MDVVPNKGSFDFDPGYKKNPSTRMRREGGGG